jgi:LPXTG-motif cell wall-anchored protein
MDISKNFNIFGGATNSMKMLYNLILLSLFGLAISASICPSQEKLINTTYACLSNGLEAYLVKGLVCTNVLCEQKRSPMPNSCLDNTSLGREITACLNSGQIADVYGSQSCAFVKCAARQANSSQNSSVSTNQSTYTGIPQIDKLIALGSANSTILGGIATVLVAIGGWYLTRKKKTKMGDFLTRIDETYVNYKENIVQCEEELRKIKNTATMALKKGDLDENTFAIVDKRLDDYMDEIKERKKSKRK